MDFEQIYPTGEAEQAEAMSNNPLELIAELRAKLQEAEDVIHNLYCIIGSICDNNANISQAIAGTPMYKYYTDRKEFTDLLDDIANADNE